MNRLLHQSFRVFLVYTLLVLLGSIPAYYAIVDYIWQKELKEHNKMVAAGIKYNLRSLQLSGPALTESISLWNQLQPEMKLQSSETLRKDSTYNVYRPKKYKKKTTRKEDRFQGLVTCFLLNGQPYCLTVETNMEESHETIMGLAIVSLGFFIVLLTGLIVLNRKLSARLWRPFYQSLEQLKNFDLSRQSDIVFDPVRITEFDALNTSLARLIAGNSAAYRQQKHFIENASHELQTPLAIVQSKLEVFLQDASLTGKQSESILQAQIALSRVNRINKNLLLLARIENNQFPETEPLDMSMLIADSMELLDVFSTEKAVKVSRQITPGIRLNANETLVEILLSNLLTNAVRYSSGKDPVTITLSQQNLEITNSGEQALLQDQLFHRFGRVAEQLPATGLGLAIVQEICRQYGWKITYHFAAGRHHFTVDFSG